MPGIEDLVRRQNEIIDRVGWAVMLTHPTDNDPETAVPFAYTLGLTARILPEFVMTGLDPGVAYPLLNDMAKRVFDGAGPIAHGSRISDLIVAYDAIIVDGTATPQVQPNAAFARYGADQVRLQQIVWPDSQGTFPWEPGYAFAPHSQPLTGRL